MRKKSTIVAFCFFLALAIIISCNQPAADNTASVSESGTNMAADVNYGGFESQEKWGEHLVTISGCNDCHTPKKMGPNGPENDMSLMLSGHPSQQPPPKFDAKEAAKNGLIVTQTFTAWTGPWGVTYAANLTSDSTGIGMWKEAQFVKALKEKKWMGLENTRPLMPPMSMMPATQMSDNELKAIFAYLKTTTPIKNVQPAAELLPPPAAGTK
jgi:cytochrome c553